MQRWKSQEGPSRKCQGMTRLLPASGIDNAYIINRVVNNKSLMGCNSVTA